MTWKDIPDAQMEAFDIARYTCTARYPRNPREQEPLTEAQLDLLYDYYTGEMTDCMREFGYDVPPAPSRQEFRESYTTNPWLPHGGAITETDPRRNAAFEAACPQLPDGLYDS